MSLATVKDIIYYFESQASGAHRLFPETPEDTEQLERDWKLFYEQFGVATPVWAYRLLVPHRSKLIRPLTQDTPWFERWTVKIAYPLYALILRKGLKLTPENAERALLTIRHTFDHVDDRLRDGRQYLLGGRLTLSDLLFAVMAAPVLVPDGYGGVLPSMEELPTDYREVVREFRARTAGRFGLRVYTDHR
jgi:glutathione S-transferase